jgi:class 3 adenylate cyclase
MATLPSGTVTFVFSDIEGSTALVKRLGDRYGDVLADHRRLMRKALGERGGGVESDTQGDAFFFAFARARDAVVASVEAQRAHAAHAWPDGVDVRMRMGLHTGEPAVGEEGYHGIDVVRAARLCSAAAGGSVLLSETTRALVGNNVPEGVEVRDLGQANLKDIQHERIYELALEERPGAFPALKAAAPETSADDLAAEIQRRVHAQILAGFEEPESESEAISKVAKLSLVGLLNLGILVILVVVVILLVRAVF